MEKKDIKDTINSLDEDLVPLFEEFRISGRNRAS
jgi:hypothetical protein